MIIKTHPKRAFSLVELLISLIVISCITAAFAPLITKKFSSSVFGFGGGGGNSGTTSITTDCASKYTSDCLLCSSSECLSCAKTCPDGQCQDASNCTCKECPTSEFPNCAKFSSTTCIQCQKGFRLVEGVCVACTSEKYSDNGKECKYCEPGFWPNDDKSACIKCPAGYICNNGVQAKCSGNTAPTIEDGPLGSSHVCAPCPDGSYCVDGVETKCSEKYENCLECDSQGCTACKAGTTLAGGKCSEVVDDVILNIGDLYVTQFNMGDNPKLPIPSTVSVLKAGSSADSCESGKCCWQGTTANANYCDSGSSLYSGCSRTICNQAAAQEICARFTLNNENWRLPTSSELRSFGNYTIGNGEKGLQFCLDSKNTNDKYSRCYQTNTCYGSYQKYCYPSYVWSSDSYTSGQYFYTYAYYLIDSGWKSTSNQKGGTGSVRCVATISDCPRGQYKNGTSCSDCSSKFAHCASCSANECLSCVDGYEVHPYNKKCFRVIEDALPVDDLYVTKVNMGDSGLPIPPTVTVVNAGTTCNAEKCCWQGQTANPSYCQNKNSSNNGGYSGCKRTVCNWDAANEICTRYIAGNKTWRLPNWNETANWYNYTVSLGASSPQVCDRNTSNTTATMCYEYYNCYGSNGGNCYPSYIWTQTKSGSSVYYSYLYNNTWYYNTGYGWYYKNTASVRCVTAIEY